MKWQRFHCYIARSGTPSNPMKVSMKKTRPRHPMPMPQRYNMTTEVDFPERICLLQISNHGIAALCTFLPFSSQTVDVETDGQKSSQNKQFVPVIKNLKGQDYTWSKQIGKLKSRPNLFIAQFFWTGAWCICYVPAGETFLQAPGGHLFVLDELAKLYIKKYIKETHRISPQLVCFAPCVSSISWRRLSLCSTEVVFWRTCSKKWCPSLFGY